MSEHCGYITKITNLRKVEKADRLMAGECFGNTVVVDLTYKDGETGVYFPTDLQLDYKFADFLGLLRKKDEDGNSVGGYMDANKRNITAVKLRGEKSDGLFIHLNCYLDACKACGIKVTSEDVGTAIGEPVCQKYIPCNKKTVSNPNSNKSKKKFLKRHKFLNFVEHADTEQLQYNLDDFKSGDYCEITIKLDGTSQRSMITKMEVEDNTFLGRIKKLFQKEPKYVWTDVCGTRRVILDSFDKTSGWYGNDKFREAPHNKVIKGLRKGEEVFYEVVGYVNESTPIRPIVDNKRLRDKEFVKQYGEKSLFNYGCAPGETDFYVYRMTMTNEDGDVIEYTPDYMRYRCEQMGVKYVPLVWSGLIPDEKKLNEMGVSAGEYIKGIAEKYYEGADPIGKTHIREGVVVRIVNRPKFTAYKLKGFYYKVLAGIAQMQVAESDTNEYSADMLSEM